MNSFLKSLLKRKFTKKDATPKNGKLMSSVAHHNCVNSFQLNRAINAHVK